MRDLLDLLKNITEAAVGLSASNLSDPNYKKRFDKVIDYITTGKAFTTVTGDTVVIDSNEAQRLLDMYKKGTLTGIVKLKKDREKETISLSSIAKTTDFGGAAVAAGSAESSGGKEGLIVKPSQIGICDKDIQAADFYEIIKNNPVLASTDYGKIIIDLAEYIVSGEYVKVPEEYQSKEKEKVRKAIVDYAGEYLGVLALLYRRSRFPRRLAFEQWLGSSIDDLTLNFPSKANTNIADSYASIINKNTNHTINISSKGTGGGAAPAISGLKVPEHIKSNPEFSTVTEFIRICQDMGTISQAFSAMDLIYNANPKALNKKWLPYLPFSVKNQNLESLAKTSLDAKKKRKDIRLPVRYKKLFSDISAKGDASDGGKLIYAIKKEVAAAINNKDGIPGFQESILQILEMNFIQQYTDYKNGEISFATQWPAKIDGNISLENKSSASDPTAGGFSFKLGRTDDSVSSEVGEPEVDLVQDVDDEEREEIKHKKISDIFRPEKQVKIRKDTGNDGAGRGRRQ